VVAFYFIYNQLANNDKLIGAVYCQIQKNQSVAGIGFILLLSVLNRYFEILKWQNLASYSNPFLCLNTKQVLAALTAGFYSKWHWRIRRKSIVFNEN
jgi:hypothetical protein